jgi:hypothetical protein
MAALNVLAFPKFLWAEVPSANQSEIRIPFRLIGHKAAALFPLN